MASVMAQEFIGLCPIKNIKESEIKIGIKVRAKFRKKPQFNANDIWFVPVR